MKRYLLLSLLILSTMTCSFGWGKFYKGDSDRISGRKPKSLYYQNFLVPSVTIGLGIYSRINNIPFNKYYFRTVVQNNFPNFHSDLDDSFQFIPIGLVYALHLTNLKKENDLLNKTILFAKSELLMATIIYPAKYLIGDQRPNNGARDAFPSGHTTQAFVAAHYLYKEYGKNYPVIGIIGYGMAVATGVFRMLNDRHWSADVLAGAGVGILCVNLAYLSHQHRFGKKPSALTLKTPIY